MNLSNVKAAIKKEVARKRAELHKLQTALEALEDVAFGPLAPLHQKHRKMSKAVRAKLSAAMKARWAKSKK